MADTSLYEKVKHLEDRVRKYMERVGFSPETASKTRIEVIHPDSWEVLLLVPYSHFSEDEVIELIDIILGECQVESRCCDYYGEQPDKEAYEWYFRHPDVPQEVYIRLEREMADDLGEDYGLPSPSGKVSDTDTVFLNLKDRFFKEIASGKKTTEYRALSQYYCDKLFSKGVPKRVVVLNRAYRSGIENKMRFEIADIRYANALGKEVSCFDEKGDLITSFAFLPRHFQPVSYAIKLGKRI